jgi:peptide/nickel transport system permease protein
MMRLLRRYLWPRWVRSGRVLGGLLALAVLLAAAGLAPVLAPHDPLAQELALPLRPVALRSQYPLGTDALGRCVLSRLLFGARASVAVAVPAALGALLLGGALGLAAGWRGGWGGRAACWLAAAWGAFPPLVLALLLVAGGAGVAVAAMLTAWPLVFRVVRAEVRAAAGRGHVAAARMLGFAPGRVLWREVAPAVAPAALALLAPVAAGAVALEAALGFIDLGGAPDRLSWGRMLADGWAVVFVAPTALLVPGSALAAALAGLVLLGDGLRATLGLALPEAVLAADRVAGEGP